MESFVKALLSAIRASAKPDKKDGVPCLSHMSPKLHSRIFLECQKFQRSNEHDAAVQLACSTVGLCAWLFDPLAADATVDYRQSNSSFDPDGNKSAVKQWLADQIEKTTTNNHDVNSSAAQLMYRYFIAGKIEEAVNICNVNLKNAALASLITLSGNCGSHASALLMPTLQELRQHRLRKSEGDDGQVTEQQLYTERILMCITGEISSPLGAAALLTIKNEQEKGHEQRSNSGLLTVFDSLSWKECFAVIINHIMPPGASLQTCLLAFERYVALDLCAPPLSDWLLLQQQPQQLQQLLLSNASASVAGSRRALIYDPAYELICYSVFSNNAGFAENYALTSVLEPSKFAVQIAPTNAVAGNEFTFAASTLPFILFQLVKHSTPLHETKSVLDNNNNNNLRLENVLAVLAVSQLSRASFIISSENGDIPWHYAALACLLVDGDATARGDLLWNVLRTFAVIITNDADAVDNNDDDDDDNEFNNRDENIIRASNSTLLQRERAKEEFLVRNLAIPIEFLHRAKAAKALESNKILLACWFLLHGGYTQWAQQLIVTQAFDEVFDAATKNDADFAYTATHQAQMQFLLKLLTLLHASAAADDEKLRAHNNKENFFRCATNAIELGLTLWLLLLKYYKLASRRNTAGGNAVASVEEKQTYEELQLQLPRLQKHLASLQEISRPRSSNNNISFASSQQQSLGSTVIGSQQQATTATETNEIGIQRNLSEKLSKVADSVEVLFKIGSLPTLVSPPLVYKATAASMTDNDKVVGEDESSSMPSKNTENKAKPIMDDADVDYFESADDNDNDDVDVDDDDDQQHKPPAADTNVQNSSVITRFFSKIWK